MALHHKNMNNRKIFLYVFIMLMSNMASAQVSDIPYREQYRPQVHFTPKAHWINDPNGMVFYQGTYHLFYQYYPDSTVWGPMHWGHAASADLVHWQEKPIALYPDQSGYIFSGSAVADIRNTSGFGKNGNTPLVAIYTSHDPAGEKARRTDFQNQNIAYSLDNGDTWIKYPGNPVLKNTGIADFRDPKVSWYSAGRKWIMTLATKDRITFFSSPDLKSWTKESEFGSELGAHGGVWECPDLITLNDKGRKIWVLIVNINPGGPNSGSATQYFTGRFNGKTFTPDHTATKWMDYGPDDYAGVTWSNTGNRKIFLGWMSNWDYANIVPTRQWRGAMTVPRELGIIRSKGSYYVTSAPVKELSSIEGSMKMFTNLKVKEYTLPPSALAATPFILTATADEMQDFSFTFSNSSEEKLTVGYNKAADQYYIDRTNAGRSDFKKEFAGKAVAPRLSGSSKLSLTLIVDQASIELFADNGLTTMTSVFFPKQILNHINIQSPGNWTIKTLQISSMKSIWK